MNRLALLALFALGCEGRWDPPLRPEDVRTCAPAPYYGQCLHALGYRWVQK
jgi:hypothetical protein